MTRDLTEIYHAVLERNCTLAVIGQTEDMVYVEITEDNAVKYTVCLIRQNGAWRRVLF